MNVGVFNVLSEVSETIHISLNIIFPLFCSIAVISTILSSVLFILLP